MNVIDCAYESDVVLAVQTGRWPDRIDEDLRRHAGDCPVCADAIVVARAMAEAAAMDDEAAARDLQLPSAGAMWLRAEVRARAEAARRATRPITLVQVAACACFAAVGGALFGATSSWFQSWIGRTWGALTAIDFNTAPMPAPLAASVGEHIVVLGIIAAFVLIAPVAIHLVARDE
jgi:hypothetical protein